MEMPTQDRTIIIGSDHVAVNLKQAAVEYLEKQGINVIDVGPYSSDVSVDYPDYAQLVAQKVLAGEGESGIAICGTGIGISIASNKVPGIRAGLCHDPYTAHQARAHNNANVLCMGAWIVSPQRLGGILDEWLSTPYEGGRHQKRLSKLETPAVLPVNGVVGESIHEQLRFGVSLSPNQSVFGPLLFAGDLEKGMRKAAENGFDLVEISLRDPSNIDSKALEQMLSTNSLELGAIATGQSCLHDAMCLGSADEAKVRAAVHRLKSHINLASKFGSAVIIGGIRGKFTGSESEMAEQYTRAVQAVRACAEYAEKEGVQLLIEPVNRYETNFINTAEEGLAFIEETGHPELKLLLDTFHMNIEEADILKTLQQYKDRIGYLHFADSNRQAPGFGHISFRRILSTLLALNFSGIITAEILPLPDDEKAIQQAGSFFASLVTTITKRDSERS